MVPPFLVPHLVVVPPLAVDPRHLVHRHDILHHTPAFHNYSPVGNVVVTDIRVVQSVCLWAYPPRVEVGLRFQESPIDLEAGFPPFRFELPYQGFDGVYDDGDDGDGDVSPRVPRFLLSSVVVVFRLRQEIDFCVDDVQ